MSWSFQSALGVFEEIRSDWDALNRSRHNHLLLDSAFVAPLLRHFGGPHVLLGIDRDSRNPGMALLVKKHPGMWETFQPSQAPLGLILLGYPDDTVEGLREMLGQLPGYALQLSVLQQDPDFSSFRSAGGQSCTEQMDYIRTARLPVTGTFEEYWKSRGSNLRHNLARRRRRLTEKGYNAELLVHRSSGAVATCVRDYGRIESKGWKGTDGTAIAEDNVQGRFYREIFEAFCTRGEGVIYQLLINGELAASDLCLCRDDMMIVLKTTYDERFEEFSPAYLMRQEIMQRIFAENGIHSVEFYGRVLDWHTRWTDQIRRMYHITCFRRPWVRRLKGIAKRFL